MRLIQSSALVAFVVGVLPPPAAAQAPSWVEELAKEIAESVERQAEQIARFVEQRVEAQGRRGGRGGTEYTESFSRTVRLGRTGMFSLQNVSGDIVITGGGGDDVRVEATKRVRHPNEAEAKSILSEVQIRIEEGSGRVDVRTDYPSRRNWSGGVDFQVTVPRDASVNVRSVSGDVRVTNANGELRAETVSGDIIISSARRVGLVKSVSGDLQITDAEAGELRFESVSGDVVVNKLKANGLDVNAVSGDVRISDVETGRATLRAVTGDVEFTGRLARNGRYQLQSHSGDVRMTPVDVRGFALEATTFSGEVRSDFELTVQSTQGNPQSNRRVGRSIRGSFGDGGTTLMLQSFSGDIILIRR
jgi:DUF4097 and DUF4098 domain-containing protein YvlB